jgi:hypothetical protein
MEKLTDKAFWIHYWEQKTDIFQKIKPNYIFHDIFNGIVEGNKIENAIEIGGFPGFFAIFLNKYYYIKPTIIDLVIHKPIIEKLLSVNGLNENTVETIEADLFEYRVDKKYNLVFSNGFIEHFDDTKMIISKHVEFLTDQGILCIILPNFKSLNGWFQKTFDKENYDKHNIACMDIEFLQKTCESLGLKKCNVSYYQFFSIWLEEKGQQNYLARFLRIICFYPLKIVVKLFRLKSKLLSPYIIIIAQK